MAHAWRNGRVSYHVVLDLAEGHCEKLFQKQYPKAHNLAFPRGRNYVLLFFLLLYDKLERSLSQHHYPICNFLSSRNGRAFFVFPPCIGPGTDLIILFLLILTSIGMVVVVSQ